MPDMGRAAYGRDANLRSGGRWPRSKPNWPGSRYDDEPIVHDGWIRQLARGLLVHPRHLPYEVAAALSGFGATKLTAPPLGAARDGLTAYG